MTATESAEYRPRWSPDGKTIAYEATKRGLTDLETTMEDTHIWLIDADGKNRRELAGAIDNRQGEPWPGQGMAGPSCSRFKSAAMCFYIGCRWRAGQRLRW